MTRIQDQVNQLVPLTAAGHLNSVMPRILETLEATGLPVTTCDGASTSFTRQQLGIAKSHVNDAACLHLPQQVHNLAMPTIVLKRQRRHQRQSINCNSRGSPSQQAFPRLQQVAPASAGPHHAASP